MIILSCLNVGYLIKRIKISESFLPGRLIQIYLIAV